MKRTKLFKKIFGEPIRVEKVKSWYPTVPPKIHVSKKVYNRKKEKK